jgi:polyphosphate kinase
VPQQLLLRVRWEDYTRAKEEMLARTNIEEAPWYIVPANDKKRARLNCIDHLLSKIPFTDVPQEEVELPDRVFNPNYERKVLPSKLYVPQKY